MNGTEFFESIYDTLREPLLVLTADLRVRNVNRAFLRTFHVSLSETIGRPLDQLGNGQWRIPSLLELLTEVIQRDRSIEDFEVSHPFETIGERTIRLNARVLASSDGREPLILVSMEDVTSERQIEAERQDLLASLQRSNADLERFAYVASHDLQEPLRMVASYTQLIATRYADKLDARGHQYVDFAVDGAVRMQALINGLLSFSRVSTAPPVFETVDMNVLVAHVWKNLGFRVRHAKAALICGAKLPPVQGDPAQLRQLFQNLLANSIKFRREPAPEITITATREGPHVVFAVRDNGIGIDPRYFEQLFIVFRRLHTRAEFPGHGLGLAMAKRIVERHDGRIWIQSTPDVGTTVYISLKAADDAA